MPTRLPDSGEGGACARQAAAPPRNGVPPGANGSPPSPRLAPRQAPLAPRHVPTQQNAASHSQDAPFFTAKLQVRTLPCVVSFENGVAIDRLVGFEGIAGAGTDFKTAAVG